MLRWDVSRTVVLACLAVLSGTISFAQVTTADVLGTVTDPTGGVLPDVKITVHSIDNAADYPSQSDSAGNYLIRLLPPGRYSIKAVARDSRRGVFPR